MTPFAETLEVLGRGRLATVWHVQALPLFSVVGVLVAGQPRAMPAVQCHYSVLGVERDVDDDGVKKAYRKLALQVKCARNAASCVHALRHIRVAAVHAAACHCLAAPHR